MAKRPSRPSSASEPTIVIQSGDGGTTVVFGGVAVKTSKVSPRVFRTNVRQGQQALKRAADQLSKVGVDFRSKPGVATYRIDPKNTDRVIRQTGRKAESGVFEDGDFKVLP